MSSKLNKISPLGKKIMQRITDQRTTKAYVYNKMGISRGTLDNWIKGETVPTREEEEHVFKILDIDLQSKETPKERFHKEVEKDVLTLELWQQVQRDTEKKDKEIDRLWVLIERLELPGDAVKRVPSDNS